jgi:hypothetical protein
MLLPVPTGPSAQIRVKMREMSNGYLTLPALLILAAGGAPGQERAPSGPLVVSEQWPRATTLEEWTRDIMRIEGLENASDTAQGKAFFEWLRLYCRMAVGGMIQAHEGGYGRERYVLDAHKNLFVYGWGYCDTCSRAADAAWSEYKGDNSAAERVVVQNEGAGFHTKYRLRLDGSHGAFDPRYGYYLVDRDAPDARVLDWPEVGNDENILKNKQFKHRSRPFFEYFGKEWEKTLNLRPVFFKDQQAWEAAGAPLESVFGDSHYQMGTRFHDMEFRLPKGAVIERHWDNTARKFYRPVNPRANRELPFLPAGRFYRVTETMLDGNWPKFDPNYGRAKPYLAAVPADEDYPVEMAGGKSIGQAWGLITYRAPLAEGAFDTLTSDSTLAHAASAPYLRPREVAAGGFAVFDFYSPYVLVDGMLEADLAGDATLAIRALEAKPRTASEPEVWSEWQLLEVRAGKVGVELGRPRFNGKDVSIHGAYRFQLRVAATPQPGRSSPAGLNALAFRLYFENGIMSMPQIFAGRNTVHFQLRDAAKLRGPVEVTYKYQTAQGERSHRETLAPSRFRGNTASYVIDAPGLERCNSITVSYP